MTLPSLARSRLVRVLTSFLVLLGTLVLVPAGPDAEADGTPNLALAKSTPGEALAGDPAIPVTLAATNSSGPDGFNLTFVDVLPPGAALGAGSPAPDLTLADAPSSGYTTLVWRNVSDLQTGVTESLTYYIDGSSFNVGSSITTTARAYVSDDPFVIPTYDGVGGDGYDTNVAATTNLVAFLLFKSEVSEEGELLRGLHEHQTVYTLEIRNNYIAATNGFAIEDWIPAGMEFLGCGGEDNSFPATEEYPGAGRIDDPGNPPALTNPCVAPDVVETVEMNPPGPLGFDVYTHVAWTTPTLATNVGAGSSAFFDYVAAIPMRENTLTWPSGVPATSGSQGSNIDNNTGALTEETLTEQQVQNYAIATGTYTGAGGGVHADSHLHTVSSEDLSIHKDVDHEVITHGATTSWELLVEVSEYTALATGIVVTDTVPDGLCPTQASGAGCGGTDPSPGYSSIGENPDGSWTVTWNLGDMDSDDASPEPATRTITFETVTRSQYQENGSDQSPVLAQDGWTNTVDLTGTVDGRPVLDESSAGQSAGPVTISKDVATRVAGMDDCSLVGDWSTDPALGYHIGDRVCWRLGVDFPVGLDTFDSDIQDYLPPGHVYTDDDTWVLGAANTVNAGDVAGPARDAEPHPGDLGVLTWTVGDGGGYVADDEYFEVIFSSTIVDPNATSSGEINANLMKYSYANTAGIPFNLRDDADVEVLEAELDLIKGVIAVNGVATGDPDFNDAYVMQTDQVTYGITITNSGDIDATDVEVWDLLPVEYDACSSNVGSISNGGVCNDGARRIDWTGAGSLTVPAGGSLLLTYIVDFPSGVSPNSTLINDAGVRSYASSTNNGAGSFTYIPSGNIDPSQNPSANTNPARDTARVRTETPTITKVATTSVTESGNFTDDQATPGEIITYTVAVVIPEGTTVYAPTELVDDLPSNLDLVSSSFTFDGGATLTKTDDPGADSVTVAFPLPGPYTNAPGTGDDTLELTINARVLDAPQNVANTVIDNTATFNWVRHDGTTPSRSANDTVTVVEPALGVSKASVDSFGDDGSVVGGELIDYTITVGNNTGPTVSTAHDVVVTDTLPAGVTPGTINNGGVWAPGPRTITWTIASLEPGDSVDLTYQVSVDNPVVVSTQFTNNVVVDYTSMAGSPPEDRPYMTTTSETLDSPLASIAKSVIPTSGTIGTELAYRIDVTIPPGTIIYDATVLDVMDPGVVFDGNVTTSCVMGGGPCVPAIDVQHVYSSGSSYSLFLGDLPTSSAQTRMLTIQYDAHLGDLGSAGDDRDNSAAIHGNTADLLSADPGFYAGPFDVTSGPAATTVNLVEPIVAIDKDVSGQVGDSDYRRAQPGDTLFYTLVVANGAGANVSAAYDITVVDTLPIGFEDPTGISGGGAWNSGARTITWTIPGPLHPNTSLALSYGATVDPSLNWTDEVPGAELINTADIPSYYGVPEAERIANGHNYRVYTDVAADLVSIELDLARIGDYVWFDVDNDGVQDVGEPSLGGVDITVTDHGSDGFLGTGDDEVHTTTTAGDGSYNVAGLPGGIFTVVVDSSDIPTGLEPSYNLDATIDHEWSGVLAGDEDKQDVDFGYTGTGSIGDTIWFDIDSDGSLDADEFGLDGITVTINWLGLDGVASADDISYVTTTNAAGQYLATDLPFGNYTVVVDPASLPTGMLPTYDADGAGSAHVSTLALGVAENNLDQDFGYAGSGSIGDLVWLDINGDGVRDAGEPGLIGVPVQLTWPGEDEVLGGGDDEVFLANTSAAGAYLFDNLPLGEYQVDVLGTLPTVATNTHDEDGNNDSSVVVSLGDGVDFDTADFGYQGSASIGDTVWWDMDGDGTVDAGEPGIPGVEISLIYGGLDGIIGNGDDLTFTTTTDATGGYLFTNLPPGNYQVVVSSGVPAGMSQTYDETGGLDATSLVMGLTIAEIHLTADFGYNGTGSIGDLVWFDRDSDGVQEPAEPGLPGVEVFLVWYGVDGSEGTADDVAMSTTTDIDGNYLFPDLPGGGYDVVVNPASLPAGMAPTYDPDGVGSVHTSSLSLGGGSLDPNQDFGYAGTGSIGDTTWFDRDGDGVLDGDEYGIGGVDIDITWAGPDGALGNADDEVFATTTDVVGNYLFSGLPPGVYSVTVIESTLPAGMTQTFDPDGTIDATTQVNLGDGEDHLLADFGYSGSGEIGDLAWLDLNGDGVPDGAEPGIPGQSVQLVWEGPDGLLGNGDDQTYSTTTGAAGDYLFTGLPPGDYEVSVTGPITSAAVNTHDEDGDLDSHTAVNLGDGASHVTSDFGYVGSAELGDFVWLDLNGDGVQDPMEPGLPAVEVTVTWYGADGVPAGGDDIVLPTYTTDATGLYTADGLPDGSYGVAVTAGVPAGLVNSYDEDLDLDDQTEVAGLVAGGNHPSADFGYAGTGSIGDTVWWDLDDDGSQGPGEPGLAGVDMTLTWAGLDGVAGTGDDVVLTTTTDGDGGYLFEHLPPGDYIVGVDEADLPAGMVQSGDPDATVDGLSAVTLGAAEANLDQDFGYRGLGSVGDFVWYDVNSDGTQDANEPGVADVIVTITFFGSDGVAGGGDDYELVAVTDADGDYLVPGLPPGPYSAAVDATTLPDGLSLAADLDGGDPAVTDFTLGASEDKADVDYPVVGDASLSGTVWNDIDGDQVADADEQGVPGVTVIVTWGGPTGPVVIEVVSGPDGFWNLPTLPPGDYTVLLDMASVPSGMAPTTPTLAILSLPVGGHEDVNFGLADLADLGSVVWIDANGDGVVDSGESGIPDVLVNLYDELGVLVDIAETGADGNYLFSNLLPGMYTVQLDLNSIPEELLATWDRDGSPDLNTVVDLTAGISVLDANFGFQVGLPVTGLDVIWFALWGSLALLLGAGMATISRLRRDDGY